MLQPRQSFITERRFEYGDVPYATLLGTPMRLIRWSRHAVRARANEGRPIVIVAHPAGLEPAAV